jgi:hypothetical protein
MNDKKYVIILDSVNRTVMGVESKTQDSEHLIIENPAIMVVSFNQKMQLQLVPAFFRELTMDKNTPVSMSYNLRSITKTDAVPEQSIIEQYEKMFAPIEEVTTVPQLEVFEKEK